MKNALFVAALTVGILIAGCSKQQPRNSETPSPNTKSVQISDGSNTWHLGAVMMNGTNIPATNVTVKKGP